MLFGKPRHSYLTGTIQNDRFYNVFGVINLFEVYSHSNSIFKCTKKKYNYFGETFLMCLVIKRKKSYQFIYSFNKHSDSAHDYTFSKTEK